MASRIGVAVYYITKKVFPKKEIVNPIILDELVTDNIQPVPRGGKVEIVENIVKRLLQDHTSKFAMIAAILTFGDDWFMTEIIELLSSKVIQEEFDNGILSVEVENFIEVAGGAQYITIVTTATAGNFSDIGPKVFLEPIFGLASSQWFITEVQPKCGST